MSTRHSPRTIIRARLSILGNFGLSDAAGRPIPVRSKKNRSLLAYLGLCPSGTSTRDRICTLLWGSHGQEQARASLRQSLAMLRKDIGDLADIIILNESETVTLWLPALAIDALELLDSKRTHDLLTLRRVAHALPHEFLSDCAISEEAFDEWLTLERGRLRTSAIDLLERLCGMESGSLRVDAARRLLGLDQLRESSHRILMRAYVAQGDDALALKQFDECRAILRRELQVEPSQDTLALRQQIISAKATPSASVGTVAPAPRSEPRLPQRLSIAVLPFKNMQAGEDQQLFSDGISEELITNLSRFRQLFVIARASSFHYRDTSLSPGEIGRKLEVKFLLYGTIKRFGNRIRITAELVDSETETTVWSERYDRSVEDVFELVDELSSTIVASTVGRIEQQLLRQVKRKQTESLAAYELYLKGKVLMHSPEREDKLAARKMFEDAIALDAEFSHALTQLAYTYLYEFFWDDSGAALERAAEIAAEAMQIDEQDAWSHMVLGLAHLYRRRFDLALKHCERAVQLNPSDPGLAAKLGLVLTDLGRAKEAIPIIERAMRLNPLNADTYSDYLGLALMGAKRFRDAAVAFESVPESSFYLHAWLAICRVQLGELDAARMHGIKIAEMSPDFTLTRVAAMEPLRDPGELKLWIDSLRLAGVRE